MALSEMKRMPEAFLLLALTFLAGQVVYLDWFHDSVGHVAKDYWMFLLISWVAVRLGTRGVVLVLIMTAAQVLVGAYQGIGFFGNDLDNGGLDNFWLYIVMYSTFGMALATYLAERNKTAEELRRTSSALKVLGHCTRAIINPSNESELFQTICRIVVEEAGYKLAWVGIPEHDPAKTIRPVAQWGGGEQYLEEIGPLTWDENAEQRAPSCTAILTGKPAIINNMLSDPDFEPWKETARKHGYASVIALPLLSENTTLGTVAIYAREPDAFDADEEKLLVNFADNLALGIRLLRIRTKNIKAERALKLALFSLDHAQDSLFRMARDARIMYVNDAACRHLGYTKKELLGMSIPDIDPDYSREAWDEHWEEVTSTGWMQFETRHKRKDGTIIPVEITTNLMKFEGENYFFSAVRDITERKQAEKNLKNSLNLLRTIIDTSPVRVFWKDRNSRLLGCNSLFARDAGFTRPDELIGKTDFEMAWKDQAELYRADDHMVMESGIPKLSYDEPQTTPDGHQIWLRTSKVPLRNENDDETIGVLGIYEDITERKQAEEALHVAAVAFETHEGILITDANANILRVNQAFQNITGYSVEEVVGKNPRILNSGRHDKAFYAKMWQQLLNTGTWTGEVWDKRKDGQTYPKWLTITAVKNTKGETTQYVAIFSDITERKRAEEAIHNLAFYDALTKLPNRRLLQDRLKSALSVSARSHHYGALLFLDLDRFKTINDTLGHDHGDLLLIEVAERIKLCVREVDTVARIGGDEFVVLLEELSASAEVASQKAAQVAEKIRAALTAPYQLKESPRHSSPSIGVCLFYGNHESEDELLKHADMAMYQAKDSGRNTVRFFDPRMQQSVETRAALESDLRRAVTDQQLYLYYQIQVDHGQRPIGAEALVRWIHPQRGLVPPVQFIPVAEESSLILEIGHWVLDTACQQIAAWSNNEQTRNLVLAINVSAQQFKQPDFVEQVAAMIQKRRIEPSRLKLELTESVVLDDLDSVVAKMLALRHGLGVTLSLDDFGTGYSSLSYLKQLPLDQIKIDQSFVRDMTTDSSDAVMVKTIIDMAQNFGFNVIAEGVETEAQLAFLKENGCQASQGYLFSKPVPIEAFEALLQDFAV